MQATHFKLLMSGIFVKVVLEVVIILRMTKHISHRAVQEEFPLDFIKIPW